jgi:hypothetical protein
MSVNYDIYIDVVGRKSVVSPTNSSQYTLPPLVQGEKPNVRLFFLTPKTSPTPDAPYDVADYSAGYTFKAALMGAPGEPVGDAVPTIASFTDSFTNIVTPYLGVQGTLDLNHPEVGTLLAGVESKSSRFEVEVTGADGYPVKVLDADIEILASLIRASANPPATQPTYYTSAEDDGRFVQKRGDMTWRWLGTDGFDYQYGGDISQGGSGKWHKLGITWVGAVGSYGILDQAGVDEVP